MRFNRKFYAPLEIIALAGILLAINFIWVRDDLGFHQFDPNPLWLIVLLISAYYGTGAGFIAAFTTGIIYFLTSPDKGLGIIHFIPMLSTFFIIAFILGEIRNQFKNKTETANERFLAKDNEMEDMNKHFAVLKQTNEELTKRNLTRTFTLTMMYETLKDLVNFDVERTCRVSLELVRDVVEATKCSIYLTHGGQLKLKDSLGYAKDNMPQEVVDMSEDIIIGRAVQEKCLISQQSLLQEGVKTINQHRRVMSVPLLNSQKEVIGVINVDELSFYKFTHEAIILFSLIAESMAIAIEKSQEYYEVESQRFYDPVTKITRYNYLRKRLQNEFQLAHRYGFVFSILLIQIKDYSRISEHERMAAVQLIAKGLQTSLRATDIPGHSSEEGSFLILLPFISEDGVRGLLKRIVTSYSVYFGQPQGDGACIEIGWATLTPSMKSVDELVAIAKKNATVMK